MLRPRRLPGLRRPPCWRPATEMHFPDDEPTLCPEHALLVRASEKKDSWWLALDAIEEWVHGPVSEDPYGHLDRLATNTRDEARREYARAAAEAYVARVVAQHGPP